MHSTYNKRQETGVESKSLPTNCCVLQLKSANVVTGHITIKWLHNQEFLIKVLCITDLHLEQTHDRQMDHFRFTGKGINLKSAKHS